MASFETAYLFLYDNEGGYANNPNDLGGETKYGISKRQYPHLDIKKLTMGEAKAIYLHDFWKPLRVEELTYQPLANHVFDMCANAGIGDAARCLQYALNACKPSVEIDGIIGSQTIWHANMIKPPEWLLEAYRTQQTKHYLRRIRMNKSQKAHIESWLGRVTA